MKIMEYVFPLRRDVNVLLRCPDDLTQAEAKRLAAFLATLVVPERDDPEAP